MNNMFSNKAALRAEEAGGWQRVVMGLAALTLVIFAVIFFTYGDDDTRDWATPLAVVVGSA